MRRWSQRNGNGWKAGAFCMIPEKEKGMNELLCGAGVLRCAAVETVIVQSGRKIFEESKKFELSWCVFRARDPPVV